MLFFSKEPFLAGRDFIFFTSLSRVHVDSFYACKILLIFVNENFCFAYSTAGKKPKQKENIKESFKLKSHEHKKGFNLQFLSRLFHEIQRNLDN
jgi:hypothetical protein